MTEFIYLHGFASGPGSNKAKAFKKRFDELGISIHIPDLQQGDFENLTLTGQIELVQALIDKNKGKSFALIGSSMGGYLASLIAQTRESVQALFLMAPGFNFLNRWRKKLDISKTQDELIPVFHYRYNKEVPLLISTNIIENGLDIPHVNTIIINTKKHTFATKESIKSIGILAQAKID